MQHWFVNWLRAEAEKSREDAKFYREGIYSNTKEAQNVLEAFEDLEELEEWAEMYQDNAERFEKWALLADDMINCGLEELALSYYDAKQALESHKFPLRPNGDVRYKSSNIIYQLELLFNKEEDNQLENLNDLQTIYLTVVELFIMGMEEVALAYYLRKKQNHPELHLPDPEFQSE